MKSLTSLSLNQAQSANFTAGLFAPAANGHPVLLNPPNGASPIRNRQTIRVLLADDHPVVRRGVRLVLSRCAHLEVVAEARDGAEALARAREIKPDIIISDLDMPQMGGLALTEALRKELPEIKVVILSMHRNTATILRVLHAGCRGYLLKDSPPEELVQAIEAVERGETYFSPEIARVTLNQFVRGTTDTSKPAPNLTAREQQVLTEIASGYSNKEIALRLGVGVRTIETHRERIMRKLNVHGIAALTRYAIAHGFILAKEE